MGVHQRIQLYRTSHHTKVTMTYLNHFNFPFTLYKNIVRREFIACLTEDRSKIVCLRYYNNTDMSLSEGLVLVSLWPWLMQLLLHIACLSMWRPNPWRNLRAPLGTPTSHTSVHLQPTPKRPSTTSLHYSPSTSGLWQLDIFSTPFLFQHLPYRFRSRAAIFYKNFFTPLLIPQSTPSTSPPYYSPFPTRRSSTFRWLMFPESLQICTRNIYSKKGSVRLVWR